MKLGVKPVTLKQANKLVGEWHRHHKEAQGLRWAIAAYVGTELVGAAIVGRAQARMTDQYAIAHVTRLVTNGHRNGCSKLYAQAAKAAREMGYDEIETFILASESGISLKAAGWQPLLGKDGLPLFTAGGSWNRPSRGGRRDDQPQEPKWKWFKVLGNVVA